MRIKEQLGIDAAVETVLVHALDKLALFVVDDQAAVRTVEYVAAAHCDLGVYLSVAVHGTVKHEIPGRAPGIASLSAFLVCPILVEGLVSDRDNDFCTGGVDRPGDRVRARFSDLPGCAAPAIGRDLAPAALESARERVARQGAFIGGGPVRFASPALAREGQSVLAELDIR